jgi:1,4-alpha-glucan branching enzyme
MPQWPAEQRGAGIVQPAAAVAAALRAANGVGSGIPQSATHMTESRLRKWIFQGKVPRAAVQRTGSRYNRFAYFALYAPTAQAVSLMGAFNGWQPHANPLARGHDGWWHGALDLTPGTHLYRFWVVDARHPQGAWRSDPENPLRVESGFRTPHSVMQID